MKDQLEITREQTRNQPLKILEAAKVEDRSVNRLLKMHEAAQLELQELEADFQFRLRESVLQTEVNLKQRFADEQQETIKQTEADVRKATTHELLTRFEGDFQKLSSEFEESQKNAIAAAESAAQLRLKEVLGEAERAKEELEADFQLRLQESILQTEVSLKQRFADEQQETIKQTEADVRKATTQELLTRFEGASQKFESAAEKWEIERQQLHDEIAKFGELEMKLSEVSQEKARLQEELRVAECDSSTERNSLRSEMKQSREELLSRFETEMEQLKADFEDQRRKSVAASEGAAEIRFAEKLAAANQDSQRREEEIQAIAGQRLQKMTDEFAAERKENRQRIAALWEEIASSKTPVSQVIRTPLSRELEAKLEEVMREKAGLEEELREANARRNAEGQSLETTQAARSDTQDVSGAVKAEIERIESRGREISGKIEDPSTDLATQIRFNRERSELEAYLKGLRYSLGEITFDKSDVTRGTTL
jgi:hypothetical protein